MCEGGGAGIDAGHAVPLVKLNKQTEVVAMWLETSASIAEILTALVAALAYGRYLWDQDDKKRRLEKYLKSEKLQNPGKQNHTILHLMAELRMTQEEILRAAFRSDLIGTTTHENRDTGLADDILLLYKG